MYVYMHYSATPAGVRLFYIIYRIIITNLNICNTHVNCTKNYGDSSLVFFNLTILCIMYLFTGIYAYHIIYSHMPTGTRGPKLH